jgi:hypothetical protein
MLECDSRFSRWGLRRSRPGFGTLRLRSSLQEPLRNRQDSTRSPSPEQPQTALVRVCAMMRVRCAGASHHLLAFAMCENRSFSPRTEIFRRDRPECRSRTASTRRNTPRGRPLVWPFTCAARTPAAVRSRIKQNSKDAAEDMMFRSRRRVGCLTDPCPTPALPRYKPAVVAVQFCEGKGEVQHQAPERIELVNAHRINSMLGCKAHEFVQLGS